MSGLWRFDKRARRGFGARGGKHRRDRRLVGKLGAYDVDASGAQRGLSPFGRA